MMYNIFMNESLLETIKLVPAQPGCYIYYDKAGEIIYVGKAKNLKRRVYSYFHKQHESVKTNVLVSQIEKLEYIITDSEVEALILENNLIKKYEPKYNIRLKDDKTYPYIKITTNEMFPRVFITRKHKNDKAKYGIKVVKTEYLGKDSNIEDETIKYLSNNEQKVDEILNTLKQNEVTPIATKDVVSDLSKSSFYL